MNAYRKSTPRALEIKSNRSIILKKIIHLLKEHKTASAIIEKVKESHPELEFHQEYFRIITRQLIVFQKSEPTGASTLPKLKIKQYGDWLVNFIFSSKSEYSSNRKAISLLDEYMKERST